ncbi:FecR family protein [Dyadobacter jiangsuensis]|uniref:FecR family protein n=1 Tax=Dyadobacter jiangsuensis TaxID=1591085 RepID=A0A2P8GJ93_9BACT|nr:FecR family protein [Dyadobacter jiangsuensis]PSL34036.1 FecR family protein [Dyadobacter jiangsuensis]
MKAFKGQEDFLRMIRKYLSGNADEKERAFLERFYESRDNGQKVLDHYTDYDREMLGREMEENILRGIAANRSKRRWLLTWPRFAAAAVVLIALGILFFSRQRPETPAQHIAAQPTDFAPGGERAVLTLADGSTVVLDSAALGRIASQGNATVTKNADGELSYQVSENDKTVAGMNTISTPAGGQYSIRLPDGSQVWLNAKSSITFSTAFAGKDRRVKVQGEVYFEVRKENGRPFVVDVDGRQQVIVTGTQFNVNAYTDEPEIRTTLLEGAVRVADTRRESLQLAPGEQASFQTGGRFRKATVDVAEAVAWKNGLFQFRETSLATIMRDIERWYNVEVTYPEGIPQKRFSGKLRRNSKASEILEILKFAGVNFRIEASESAGYDGRIVVLPAEKNL